MRHGDDIMRGTKHNAKPRGESINVTCQKAKDYYYFVMNFSGVNVRGRCSR